MSLKEVALLNRLAASLHLALCSSFTFVKTWPVPLPVCVSVLCVRVFCVCVYVCVTAIFSDASFPLIFCWHGEQAAGSLHSNLPSFVIACPCDTDRHTRTHTQTVTNFLQKVATL